MGRLRFQVVGGGVVLCVGRLRIGVFIIGWWVSWREESRELLFEFGEYRRGAGVYIVVCVVGWG